MILKAYLVFVEGEWQMEVGIQMKSFAPNALFAEIKTVKNTIDAYKLHMMERRIFAFDSQRMAHMHGSSPCPPESEVHFF